MLYPMFLTDTSWHTIKITPRGILRTRYMEKFLPGNSICNRKHILLHPLSRGYWIKLGTNIIEAE